jgi:hypothetical protein
LGDPDRVEGDQVVVPRGGGRGARRINELDFGVPAAFRIVPRRSFPLLHVLYRCLRDACKDFSDRKLFDFNSVSPDFVLKIGDVREGLMAMGRSVGLDPAQMQKLEAKTRMIGG